MGTVTESIFSGATSIIPLAEVHHIEIDKLSNLIVVLNGTTYSEELGTYNNHAYLTGEEAEAFKKAWCRYRSELESESLANLASYTVMRFKDLPQGARFKFPGGTSVWVALETHGDGLIAKWEGLQNKGRQCIFSFVDDMHNLEAEVHALND